MAALPALRHLDVSQTLLPAFPLSLCQLTALESLDVSTEHYGEHREIPFRHLPDRIANMQGLRKLGLDVHRFAELPEALRTLPHLRSLSLRHVQMPALPAWLGELPALQEIDVRWAEIGDDASLRNVVAKLQERGVKVQA